MSNSLSRSEHLVNCSMTASVCAFMKIAVEKSALKGMLSSSKFGNPFDCKVADEVRVMFAARNTRILGHEFCSFSTEMDVLFVRDSTLLMSSTSRFGHNSYFFIV